nr:MAG TPA: hypothetical protein [Bacteriophage sp.]
MIRSQVPKSYSFVRYGKGSTTIARCEYATNYWWLRN